MTKMRVYAVSEGSIVRLEGDWGVVINYAVGRKGLDRWFGGPILLSDDDVVEVLYLAEKWRY